MGRRVEGRVQGWDRVTCWYMGRGIPVWYQLVHPFPPGTLLDLPSTRGRTRKQCGCNKRGATAAVRRSVGRGRGREEVLATSDYTEPFIRYPAAQASSLSDKLEI